MSPVRFRQQFKGRGKRAQNQLEAVHDVIDNARNCFSLYPQWQERRRRTSNQEIEPTIIIPDSVQELAAPLNIRCVALLEDDASRSVPKFISQLFRLTCTDGVTRDNSTSLGGKSLDNRRAQPTTRTDYQTDTALQ